ncbi:alpha-L-fucosidase [Lacibacter cauensis]|uniref:alpha-L-fucosidase n=1 Tax=Lacibacter cauensis TaxID=510947 RepID=A0A562SJK4_9BACT|nr:alpha-L-fucosidase [Lacibacter cauensis]TWI81273.1 alpha-L-fucosidase [Lacibacter cauensis]
MIKIIFSAVVCVGLAASSFGQKATPVPTPQQLKWHNSEYYLFAHFGPNTFTDKEWGHGDEPEDIFNPAELDCRQWCRIAKQAGATGIIITAKHHDGFCLWPSKYSKHTVRESKWKNGRGDVLKELSQACKEFGLNFGVYISPWDRNHPDYGTEKYNDVFVNMMKELFTNYGPITELWWDGANGEGPNGKKQLYDWKRFKETVRKLSPTTVVFSDVGPDVRWVGNEKGIAGITNWNLLNIDGFTPGIGAPPTDTLNSGNKYGTHWIPAECDVSIRPGWFYHAEEDNKVKSAEELFQLYVKSVGRGATLLLNIPPDRRGKFHANDSAALVGFRKLRQQSFKTNLLQNAATYYLHSGILKKTPALSDGKSATTVTMEATEIHSAGVELKENKKINCIVLKEDLRNGQQCAVFKLLLFDKDDKLIKEITGTTIGRKRILTFPAVNINTVELTILEQKGTTKIAEIEAYYINEQDVEQ